MRVLLLLFLYFKTLEEKNHPFHGNNWRILSNLAVVENHAVLSGFLVRSAKSTHRYPFSP